MVNRFLPNLTKWGYPMGWDFQKNASKEDIIARLTKDEEGEATEWSNREQRVIHLGYRYSRRILEKSVQTETGYYVLWTVEEVVKHKQPDEITRHIGCYLIRYEPGDGYGYKAMSESVHPYYYSCPLQFLDMVPVANQAWRDKVKQTAIYN